MLGSERNLHIKHQVLTCFKIIIILQVDLQSDHKPRVVLKQTREINFTAWKEYCAYVNIRKALYTLPPSSTYYV